MYQVEDVNQTCFTISEQQWQQNLQQLHVLLRYLAIPLQIDDNCIWLAIDDPSNSAAIEIFSFLTGKYVQPIILSAQSLKLLLRQLQAEQKQQLQLENNLVEPSPATNNLQYAHNLTNEANYVMDAMNDNVILQQLSTIFDKALELQASDIHFEFSSNAMQIRMRVDGLLQDIFQLDVSIATRVISRLKLDAKLDISESRIPQDGSFISKTSLGDKLELRISVIPTYYGEKIVLRLQQNTPIALEFAALGMNEQQQVLLQQALQQPQGLILITGPTGSGKSISLYSALSWLSKQNLNILTAEDPVEVVLPKINQCQINLAINLNFAQLLRAFLRQDPDVIMIGEIRDDESASMAIKATQTGHLVLASLHTNDAPSAITRLQQLNVSLHEIQTSLLLVVAQRLVRLRCKFCLPQAECTQCFAGYRQRTGIFQFLSINRQESTQQLNYQLDFIHLWQSAEYLLKQGLTDQTEITRVLGVNE